MIRVNVFSIQHKIGTHWVPGRAWVSTCRCGWSYSASKTRAQDAGLAHVLGYLTNNRAWADQNDVVLEPKEQQWS